MEVETYLLQSKADAEARQVRIEPVCLENHERDPLKTGGFTRHYMMLYALVYGMEAKNVFEFGMGFTTQTIFEALKSTGGRLTTVDLRSKEHFGELPIFKNDLGAWVYHNGKSGEVVPQIDHSPYDIVLHDGSHNPEEVTEDLNNILPYIKKGGLLLVHDTNHYALGVRMMSGVEGSDLKDYQYEILTLPYSFGLTIIRLLSSKTDEEVEINWQPKK